MLIVQISDLHMTLEGREIVPGVDTFAYAAAAVERIKALPQAPDAVIVTGDIADEILPAEYAAAARLLGRLDGPVYVVPGNHDDRDMIRAAFPGHGYLPEGRLNFVVESGPVRLIGLDSLVDGAIHGELGAQTLTWLDDALKAAPDQPTLVFLHHPPFVTGLPVMDGWGLKDAVALEAVISRHPQVQRVVSGHVHRHATAAFGGTLAMTAPSLCHAIALGPGDDNGNPLYALEPPGLLLHRWDGGRMVTHLLHTTGDWHPRRF